MSVDGIITLTGLIAAEFARRGWRDPGDVALTLAGALVDGRSPDAAARRVSSAFLAQNGIRRQELATTLAGLDLPRSVAGPASTSPRASLASVTPPHSEPPPSRRGQVARWIVAVAMIAAAIAFAATLPPIVTWDWLVNHPSGLALRALGVAVVVFLALAVATRRKDWLLFAAVPALIALLALLGK